MAFGMVFLGLTDSAAAKPTNSVPEKANAAVTNTEHKPLNPWLKAPGLCQYLPPIYPPFGPPPQTKTIPKIMKPITAITLMVEKTNSASP